MKKFLREILLYLTCLYVAGTFIIYILLKTAPERFLGYYSDFVMWDFQKKVIASPEKIGRNIIIGDSRAMADINPAIMGHSFTNLAIAGASTYEGYLTLKKILQSKKIDTLIVSYGAYHYTVSDNFHDMSLPYNFPTITQLSDLESVENKFGITIDNTPPSTLRILNRRFIYYHIPINNFRATFVRNLFQRKIDPYTASMSANSGHVLFGKKDSSNELSQEIVQTASTKSFSKNPVLILYLDSTIKLAKKNHICVLMVPPPLNYATYKALEKTQYLTEYNSFLSSFKNQGPAVSLIYLCPYLPASFFGDRSHLNARGSNYFSNLLKKELEKSNDLRK
ncbi:MAG: hypothetical protein ACHQHN_07670 [Sphingobacteriales bacterium]